MATVLQPAVEERVREIAREVYAQERSREAQPAPGAVSPETESTEAECVHGPSSIHSGLCGRCGEPIVLKWVLRPGPRGDSAQ